MTAARPLNGSGCPKKVRNLAVSVYEIVPSKQEQLELFSSRTHAVSDVMDRIAAANEAIPLTNCAIPPVILNLHSPDDAAILSAS